MLDIRVRHDRIIVRETDSTGTHHHTILYPRSDRVIRQSTVLDSDIPPVYITGRIVNVSGDDYGFPGHVVADIDIEWSDGCPERISIDAALWDLAHHGEAL